MVSIFGHFVSNKEIFDDIDLYISWLVFYPIYFLSQLLVLDVPIIVLLNMADLVNPSDIVNIEKLTNELNVYKIIPFSASKKIGLDVLNQSIGRLINSDYKPNHSYLTLSKENKELFKKDKNGNLLRDESGNLHKINDDNV